MTRDDDLREQAGFRNIRGGLLQREVLEPLLTLQQVADLLQVSERAIYGWITRRYRPLPCLRAGNRLRFCHADLMTWLGSQDRRKDG